MSLELLDEIENMSDHQVESVYNTFLKSEGAFGLLLLREATELAALTIDEAADPDFDTNLLFDDPMIYSHGIEIAKERLLFWSLNGGLLDLE